MSIETISGGLAVGLYCRPVRERDGTHRDLGHLAGQRKGREFTSEELRDAALRASNMLCEGLLRYRVGGEIVREPHGG